MMQGLIVRCSRKREDHITFQYNDLYEIKVITSGGEVFLHEQAKDSGSD